MSFYVYREMRDFGSFLFATFCCLLFIGPGLLIGGIALLISAGSNTRDAGISVYNNAVSPWSNAGPAYAAFANVSTKLSSSVGYGTVNLLSTTTPVEQPAVESGAGNSYANRLGATYLDASSPRAWLPQQPFANSRPVSLAVTYTPSGGAPDVRTELSLPVTAYTVQRSYGSCRSSFCPLGYYSCSFSDGKCEQWWVLNSVCLVYNPSTSGGVGAWAGSGCMPQPSSNVDSVAPSAGVATSGLAVASYSMYTSQPGGSLPATAPRLSVRSAADPWVVAMRETRGTGSFGLTTGQKAGAGIALLVIGALLLFVPCIMFVALRRCCEHRRVSKRGMGVTTTTTTTYVGAPQQVVAVGYAGQPTVMVAGAPGVMYAPQPVQQQYVAYTTPQYAEQQQPQPQYGMQPQYAPQQPQYAPQQPQYAPQQPQYAPQQPQYTPQYAPQPQYAQAPQYQQPPQYYK